MLRNPVPTSCRPRLARIWRRRRRRRRRRTDQMTSFRYHIAVMFPWMVTLGFFLSMKTL